MPGDSTINFDASLVIEQLGGQVGDLNVQVAQLKAALASQQKIIQEQAEELVELRGVNSDTTN